MRKIIGVRIGEYVEPGSGDTGGGHLPSGGYAEGPDDRTHRSGITGGDVLCGTLFAGDVSG